MYEEDDTYDKNGKAKPPKIRFTKIIGGPTVDNDGNDEVKPNGHCFVIKKKSNY